jgi:type IV secretory pathway TraG/TraD family ATPase VirD4
MLKIETDELKKYVSKAKGDSSRYLAPGNDRLLGSVLSTIVNQVRPLKLLSKAKPKFSIKEWVRDSKKRGWLFLLTTPEQRELMGPMIACSIDLVARELMNLEPDENRRLWFVQDELPSLGRIPVLKSLMSESRKYGGCVIAGIQSINQLHDLYGVAEGSTILSQFNTRIMFRNLDFRLAKQFSETFGTAEYSEAMESFSYGSHEMRDGVSVSRKKVQKPLLSVDEIMNLENLECFISQPDPEIRLAKLKMRLKKMPLLCKNIILDSKISQMNPEDSNVEKISITDLKKDEVILDKEIKDKDIDDTLQMQKEEDFK